MGVARAEAARAEAVLVVEKGVMEGWVAAMEARAAMAAVARAAVAAGNKEGDSLPCNHCDPVVGNSW